jgi:hypothetical protein
MPGTIDWLKKLNNQQTVRNTIISLSKEIFCSDILAPPGPSCGRMEI